MKVADTNRPPKYTLTYFKLSYGDLQTVTLQTLEKPQNRKKQNFLGRPYQPSQPKVKTPSFVQGAAPQISQLHFCWWFCICMHDDCTHFYIFGIHVFPLVFSCINFFMWAVVLKGGGQPPNPSPHWMRPSTRVLLRKGVIHPHGNSIRYLHISHNTPCLWALPHSLHHVLGLLTCI